MIFSILKDGETLHSLVVPLWVLIVLPGVITLPWMVRAFFEWRKTDEVDE